MPPRRLVARMVSAVVLLDALQEVADQHVAEVLAGGRRLLDARGEQRVGLVEEQHRRGALGLGEHLVDVLLGLADVLADQLGQVDGVQRTPERRGDRLGGRGLARAGPAGEQRDGSGGDGEPCAQPEVVARVVAVADVVDEPVQRLARRVAQHEVVERPLGQRPPAVPDRLDSRAGRRGVEVVGLP